MRLNLTVEEAIYILNRLKGREINDMAELMFKMYNTEKLVLKIKKQINKELLKKYPKEIENEIKKNYLK